MLKTDSWPEAHSHFAEHSVFSFLLPRVWRGHVFQTGQTEGHFLFQWLPFDLLHTWFTESPLPPPHGTTLHHSLNIFRPLRDTSMVDKSKKMITLNVWKKNKCTEHTLVDTLALGGYALDLLWDRSCELHTSGCRSRPPSAAGPCRPVQLWPPAPAFCDAPSPTASIHTTPAAGSQHNIKTFKILKSELDFLEKMMCRQLLPWPEEWGTNARVLSLSA